MRKRREPSIYTPTNYFHDLTEAKHYVGQELADFTGVMTYVDDPTWGEWAFYPNCRYITPCPPNIP